MLGHAPWLRKCAFAALAAVLLVGLLYVFRTPLLIGAANVWIVDEPITKADAVVVLGGGLQYRAFEAIKLYEAGKCRKILVVKAKLQPSDEAGVTEPEYVKVKRLLEKKGVPSDAIIEIGNACSSTWDDIVAARQWAASSSAIKLLIPTDLFHTRRVRWICRKTFGNSTVNASVMAINPPWYDRTNWWRNEEGLIAFQNEVMKFGFYLLKYRNGRGKTEDRDQRSEVRGQKEDARRILSAELTDWTERIVKPTPRWISLKTAITSQPNNMLNSPFSLRKSGKCLKA
jgi:uncharacterized SAM-binding protein YcdF (DUF218 family)